MDEHEFERTRPYRNQPLRYDMQRLDRTRPAIPLEYIPSRRYATSYLDLDCVKNRKRIKNRKIWL